MITRVGTVPARPRAALGRLIFAPALADSPDGATATGVPVDPVARALARERATPDPAPLWAHRDAALQRDAERALADLGLTGPIAEGKLAVALVDVSDVDQPRVAAVNGDRMLYAASLPKIAILLAAFQKIHDGSLAHTPELDEQLVAMIRFSSNEAATELMRLVGKPDIAQVLIDYRLYDPRRGGGLWVGKEYAKAGVWRRDPLHNLSHGATAMQVARFYYLLETGRLVSPRASREMKRILSGTGIEHKFAKALSALHPEARIYRKSGTWGAYHSDSALVEQGDRAYILVGLCEDERGGEHLSEILTALDALIEPGRQLAQEAPARSVR